MERAVVAVKSGYSGHLKHNMDGDGIRQQHIMAERIADKRDRQRGFHDYSESESRHEFKKRHGRGFGNFGN